MRNRLIELHQQRGRLIERIALQRGILAQQLVPLQNAFGWADRVARLIRDAKTFAQRHPLGIAVAVGAVILLKPRTVWRWTWRGLLARRALRTWRNLGTLVPAFLSDRLRGQR